MARKENLNKEEDRNKELSIRLNDSEDLHECLDPNLGIILHW